MNMLSNVLDLDDKMTKMTVLLGASALLVLIVKNNEKALTSNLSNSLLLLIILGTLFFAQQINDDDSNDSNKTISNDIDNSSISDLDQGTVSENFQDNATYASTEVPSDAPTLAPSETLSEAPSDAPTLAPSETLSEAPLLRPPSPPPSEAPSEAPSVATDVTEPVSEAASEAASVVSGMSSYDDNKFASFDNAGEVPKVPENCFPKDIRDPSELLPKDKDSVWAKSTPMGQGELSNQNFLNAGHHVGVNTVGQSLRNANRQLRSDPPNPQVKVSPWLQSTIEPDINRRPLEIA